MKLTDDILIVMALISLGTYSVFGARDERLKDTSAEALEILKQSDIQMED